METPHNVDPVSINGLFGLSQLYFFFNKTFIKKRLWNMGVFETTHPFNMILHMNCKKWDQDYMSLHLF